MQTQGRARGTAMAVVVPFAMEIANLTPARFWQQCEK